MCGIVGVFNRDGSPLDRNLLHRMTTILRHRGPDGCGYYTAADIGLGHRRLSIIDLEGGSQPISNETGTLHLIFNGEIYNFVELREELLQKGHVFRTRSDTEVIVHGYEQWGRDCVKHFNGMFAFALWDASRRELFLARDHLGVKPLYYTFTGNRFLFGSEIKALLVDPECTRAVNLQSLAELFTFRHVPSPNTLFQHIQKLPPGHRMVVDYDRVEIQRYWTWTPRTINTRNDEEWIELYRSLLQDAVRLQLRSDVPVGLFLSSGIDSATLLAIMTETLPTPVHTFTIGFEDGETTNETDDARALAERFGAQHSEMVISSQDYQAYYDRYLWDLEEPVGNETAVAFFFVSLLASREVKVALTGQGADEPWAGYHRYIGVKLSQLYSRLPLWITEGLISPAVDRLPKNERLKRGAASLAEQDILSRFAKIYSFYSAPMKARLFQAWMREELNGIDAKNALKRLQQDVRNLEPLLQMLYIDTRGNLPDDLLMVNDKTSMAVSIESRVPFLDYRLVELIESIPANLKLRGFQGKYLHKRAVGKWLPQNIVYRKKKGFANPVGKWLRTRMRSYVDDCLLAEDAAVNRYFNASYIRELVRLHETGREDYLRHIYLLISFELWHRQFIDGWSHSPASTQANALRKETSSEPSSQFSSPTMAVRPGPQKF